MAKVYFIHQVVAVSDSGCIACKCGAADYYIFADIVIISDNQAAFFSCIVKVLRLCSQDSILMYLVSFSHFSTFQDTGV
jgi:hypothetical protein